jgi:hypothetical protein
MRRENFLTFEMSAVFGRKKGKILEKVKKILGQFLSKRKPNFKPKQKNNCKMKIWILLLCASVLGTEEQPSKTKTLLKGAFHVGCLCVAAGSVYFLFTSSQSKNNENALVCSRNIQSSNSAVVINAISCSAIFLQNSISNMGTNISKLLTKKTDEFRRADSIYELLGGFLSPC